VRAAGLALVVLAVMAGGCSDSGLSPSGERGRQVYLAHCVACHNTDPAQPGPVGPPVKGASRALLEAKVLKGTYPPGHTPKRSTTVMVPLPAVAPDIAALADYLR
jgi:mono/diheme cytochrome c family protein